MFVVNTKVIHRSDGMRKMETIGARLKRLRMEAGLSQAELARRAGYSSQGGIGNIEVNKRGYGDKILDVAKVLGVSPEYLRGETDYSGTNEAASNTGATSGCTLDQAIEALGRQFLMIDATKREAPATRLFEFAKAPDSPSVRNALMQALLGEPQRKGSESNQAEAA